MLDPVIMPLAEGSGRMIEAIILPVKATLAKKPGCEREAEEEYTEPHVIILRLPQALWNRV